jgi:hypothetical protein
MNVAVPDFRDQILPTPIDEFSGIIDRVQRSWRDRGDAIAFKRDILIVQQRSSGSCGYIVPCELT